MKNEPGTHKNVATEKQLQLIEKLEIESADLIEKLERMCTVAVKGSRVTHNAEFFINSLRGALSNTHYDPQSWITEVLGAKKYMETAINAELEMDARRAETYYPGL